MAFKIEEGSKDFGLLTDDEVNALLKRLNSLEEEGKGCSFCGATSFALLPNRSAIFPVNSSGLVDATFLVTQNNSLLLKKYAQVIQVSCTNCGKISSFRESVLLSRADEAKDE